MLGRNEATTLVKDRLFPAWDTQRGQLDRIDRWYRWHHEDIRLPRSATAELKELSQLSKVPWLQLVVTAAAQAMYVDGYRSRLDGQRLASEDDPDTAQSETDSPPWQAWLANQMDRRQVALHRAMLAYGYAFTTVLPGTDPLTGDDQAVIRGVSPRKMVALYDDPAEDDWPQYALRIVERKGDDHLVRLYDDEAVYELRLSGSGRDVTLVSEPAAHGAGVCPVIRYANMLDLDGRTPGEVEPFIAIAARINKTSYDRMLVQHFNSWKIRYVTGMAEPDTEEDANRTKMRLRQDDLLIAEDPDTKFGQLDETSLGGFIDAHQADIETLAAASQTPTHELTGKMANMPLALDTIVPLPDGSRKTMAEVAVSDQVVDPSGNAVTVTALSPVYHGRQCYRLRFDDGNEIVADAEHKWSTTHFVDPRRPYVRYQGGAAMGKGPWRTTSVVTTAEIAATLKTSMGTNNHFISVAAPVDGEAQSFPIDPYVLGVWLGDGDHIHGSITSHMDDAGELAAHLRSCGETVRVRPYPEGDTAHWDTRLVIISKDHARCPFGHDRPLGTGNSCRECGRIRDSYRYNGERREWPGRWNVSFATRLEALNLRRNKHIPEQYFQGSFKQRLALLQGIMDTDGTVNRKQGSAVITLHHERLVRDVHRLIQSLGHKVNLRERTWKSSALGTTGTCWRMSWSAIDPVFRLQRKLDLQRTEFTDGGDGKSSSPFRRYIVACDPVDSVPVRCLTVDSESHLFCVTDGFIATHNSAEALAAARASLTQKITERQKSAGAAHAQTLKLAAALDGHSDYATDVTGRVTWQDTEIRSISQAADALGKMVTMLGVPPTATWNRIPGVERNDVQEWIELAERGDPITKMQERLDMQAMAVKQGASASADVELDDPDPSFGGGQGN
jgi:hypothetical protein